MDKQTTTIKKYLKTDNLQKTDRPFHAVNILSFRVADLERFILQLKTSPEDTDEDQCDASPREWNPVSVLIFWTLTDGTMKRVGFYVDLSLASYSYRLSMV